MKCPKCEELIDYVIFRNYCEQKVGLTDGNVANDYSEENEVVDTVDIECPECYVSLLGIIVVA